MAVVDGADVSVGVDVQPPLLPPLPALVEPHTALTAFSSHIAALHALSRRPATRTQLLAELDRCGGQCDDPLSALCPLLLHCSARLQAAASAAAGGAGGELQAAQQLWSAVRNLLTQRRAQLAFIQSACFSGFLSCLASLCSSPVAVVDPALPELGCQLLANSIADNADAQSIFLQRHLRSARLAAIVRSCPRRCLASLLYALHTALPTAAAQSAALDSAGGAALLAEMTLRLSSSRQQQPQQRHHRVEKEEEAELDEDDADDGIGLDGGLLFPSLMHRLFVQHSSLLSLLSDCLRQQHAAQWQSGMTFLLSTLLTVSSCSLDSEHAAHCASANCLSVVSMLLARYPIEPSERLQDDEAQYAQLQRTLLVDAWTHACVLLLEHVLSSWLSLSPSSVPPLPLLQRLFAADVWYLLIALLASATVDTPAPHSPPSASIASATAPSSHCAPPPPAPFGFQSDLLRLLSLLSCCPASHPPPYARLTAVSFLAHTTICAAQPLQREYSVVGIRGLSRWEDARQALAALEAQQLDGQRDWSRRGVQLTLDQHSRKVRVGRAPRVDEEQQQQQPQQHSMRDAGDVWSIERMAAVRSAGRRVDWGQGEEDEPFTSADFM